MQLFECIFCFIINEIDLLKTVEVFFFLCLTVKNFVKRNCESQNVCPKRPKGGSQSLFCHTILKVCRVNVNFFLYHSNKKYKKMLKINKISLRINYIIILIYYLYSKCIQF